jgi:hypothetical protein
MKEQESHVLRAPMSRGGDFRIRIWNWSLVTDVHAVARQ